MVSQRTYPYYIYCKTKDKKKHYKTQVEWMKRGVYKEVRFGPNGISSNQFIL